MSKILSNRSLAALAVAAMTMGVANAQTQSDVHRDAATRNVGGDAFMTQYARAFYCNLPDDNNGIVIQARSWNNTTGANNNQYRFPLTQIFDDVWASGNVDLANAILDYHGRFNVLVSNHRTRFGGEFGLRMFAVKNST